MKKKTVLFSDILKSISPLGSKEEDIPFRGNAEYRSKGSGTHLASWSSCSSRLDILPSRAAMVALVRARF